MPFWDVDSSGPVEPRIRWGSRSPMRRGSIDIEGKTLSAATLLQRNPRFEETLDQVHFSCRKLCWKVTKCDVHILWLTQSTNVLNARRRSMLAYRAIYSLPRSSDQKGRTSDISTTTVRHRATQRVQALYSRYSRSRYNTPSVWTKWNGLVADNVARAAGASILLLARGVFAGKRSACGVRWAWRITAGLCHAFLVLP